MKQNTVNEGLKWTGIGLHTGALSNVSLEPKNCGFGIKFTRTDLEKSPLIAADTKNVSSTIRGTNLKVGEVEVMTVEHLISALVGAGVDNVLVHVDGPEIPILDGSAAVFYNDIIVSGLVEQEDDKNVLVIDEIITFVDEETGAELTAIPSKNLSIEVMLDYPTDIIGKQYATYNSDEDFGTEISAARTFVLASDLKQLADQELIKGGDVDNAVVLMEPSFPEDELKEVLKKLGKENIDSKIEEIKKGVNLKYSNELARHKILDLMGDLRLSGAAIQGRIIAKKPGHTSNVEFAKLLKVAFLKQKKLKGKPIYDMNVPPIYEAEQIKGFLPHRYPFLLVDRIIEIEPSRVVGVKNVTINEPLFTGHFPDNPVFPGVLQMEALAQTGGLLALNGVEDPSKWDTYFLKMDNVKFKKMVRPGDTMILKMELLSPIRRGIVNMQGTVYVGDSIVSEGELTAQIVKRPD